MMLETTTAQRDLSRAYGTLFGEGSPSPAEVVNARSVVARLRMGFIYFVRAGHRGRVKIGWTRGHPRVRIQRLQIASSDALLLLGTRVGSMEDEKALHSRLGRWRVRGEWFEPVPAVLHEASREPGLVLAERVRCSPSIAHGLELAALVLAGGTIERLLAQ